MHRRTSPTPSSGCSRRPYVGAVVYPGGASQTRKQLDGWQDWAKARGARGLAYVLIGEDGELGGPVAKNLSDAEKAGLADHVGAKPGDCVFFGAGAPRGDRARCSVPPAWRSATGPGSSTPDAWSFLWVVDAPLFEPVDETDDVAVGHGAWTAVHHAFTAPKPEHLDHLEADPGEVLANAYDIVCNGNEIGGGSIRIHREDVQSRVFKVMGLSADEAEEKFGFLLEGLALRRPAPRRHRLRLGPRVRPARRHPVDPRGHRLPQDRRRPGPAHRRARTDHPGAAQGSRRRRPAGGREAEGLTSGPSAFAPTRATTGRAFDGSRPRPNLSHPLCMLAGWTRSAFDRSNRRRSSVPRAMDALEDRVATLCGVINAAHGELVDLIADALDADLWAQWGIHSPTHWLSWQCGLSQGKGAPAVGARSST